MLAAVFGGYIPHAYSGQECTPAVAHFTSVEGTVELRRANGENWQTAQPRAVLCAGDQIRVSARSRAGLKLHNETTLRLDQSSTLTLRGDDLDGSSLLELLFGALHVITRTPQPFKVKTPFVNAGVDGTEFLVDVRHDEARIAVYEGRVSASNEFGVLSLVVGEIARVARNQAPRKEVMVRPVDAVQWALYYPSIIDYNLGEKMRGSAAGAALRESIDLYRQGRLADAISRTDDAPEGRDDPRFLSYRAGLLLMVGQVDEATAEIEHALAVDPRCSDALALEAVIAVVQNNKEQALIVAARAVEFDPSSPVAHMALSYAQQARFEIAEALASVLKALEFEPNSGLAWARLAELQMSSGELDAALDSARRAVQIDAGIAKTQYVLGFANLTRFDTKAAKNAFERAIELDQAEPLARLGLGLAKIREGDLTGGREEIEIAVSLDPGNSLMRSYLGKAYYEEKRDKLAGGQFELAKVLNPRDPTPWFYDAIRKQTINRPVEAAQDLGESIELNDSRAVYRSRLLLDDDLAARSVSQARIFRDLGFDRLASVEGHKSLALDPDNFSAHRLLADAYASLPRYEIARVSEMLQSQLYQPINFAPLQPQMTEDKLFILAGTGPAAPGFNEFNNLFTRNMISAQVYGLIGSNNTRGDQVLVSAIKDRVSFSFGQFQYSTDGIQENANQEKVLYDAFIQAEITDRTSLLAELRKSDSTEGDLSFRFDPVLFSQEIRQEREFARLGGRHKFSTELTLIGHVSFQSGHDETDFPRGENIFKAKSKDYAGELQCSWRAPKSYFLFGAGEFRSDVDQDLFSSRTSFTQKATNAYGYATFDRLVGDLKLLFGLSRDGISDPNIGGIRAQWNPKFGLVWNPNPDTTIRLAAFRTLARPLLAEQTIEPTQVAGFNQFFLDELGTESRAVGLGLDKKVSSSSYVGIALSGRNLEVPQAFAQPAEFFRRRERDFRAYVNWIPTRRVAGSIEYMFEDSERDPGLPGTELFTDVKTHNLLLTLGYFDPSGWSSVVKASRVDQQGTFVGVLDNAPFQGGDQFWITDLALSYRLPQRLGLLTVEVRNLFDRHFRFQETNFATPTLSRERFVFTRVQLSF